MANKINEVERSEYISSQIITYMGNKRKLLGIIGDTIEKISKEMGKKDITIGDGFSGSGVVSRLFKTMSRELYTNDLAGYSKTLNECYLANPSEKDKGKIKKYIDEANKLGNEKQTSFRTDHLVNRFVTKTGFFFI